MSSFNSDDEVVTRRDAQGVTTVRTPSRNTGMIWAVAVVVVVAIIAIAAMVIFNNDRADQSAQAAQQAAAAQQAVTAQQAAAEAQIDSASAQASAAQSAALQASAAQSAAAQAAAVADAQRSAAPAPRPGNRNHRPNPCCNHSRTPGPHRNRAEQAARSEPRERESSPPGL